MILEENKDRIPLLKELGLEQWFPEWVPLASIISTIWKLDKNVYSCALSQPTESQPVEIRPINLCFTSPLGDSDSC